MEPTVSIIIPSFNSANYLNDSIGSVLSQTYDEFECIIIDDGSTDDTKSVVEKFIAGDSRVKYFYKQNGGVASARNYGVSKSRGSWIQILDADDWLYSTKIEKQLSSVNINEGTQKKILIYSDYEIQNNKNEKIENKEVIIGELTQKEFIRKIVGRKKGLFQPTPLHINNVLMSRNIFCEYTFNENMVTCGDLDFFYRLLNSTITCKYVPMISMCYRSNDNGVSKNVQNLNAGYTAFLESILQYNKSDLELFPNLRNIFEIAIMDDNNSIYNRLKRIIRESKVPYFSKIMNREFDIRWLIVLLDKFNILFYSIKSFILVKRYLSSFSKRFHLLSKKIYRQVVPS